MMTNAYDEIFLDDAAETLGAATEYAVLQCNTGGQIFFDLFLASGVAAEFGKGNPLFVSGKSGAELVHEIYKRVGKQIPAVGELPYADYPPEYWIGWILAYYQWKSGLPFEKLLPKLKYGRLYNLYGTLHEADPEKSAEVFGRIMRENGVTNLARIRKDRGFSQSELAKASGVSIRSIQLYEQRKADIDNAQYNNLHALASVLHCTADDLTEGRI